MDAIVSNKMNELEAALLDYPHVDLPQIHRFQPGGYLREVWIPAGTVLTTRRHLTNHHFVVIEGECDVVTEDGEMKRIKAGDVGFTIAGTRRTIHAISGTRWLTFHVTDLTDPDEIAETITEQAENPFIDPNHPRLKTWQSSRNPSITMNEEKYELK